MIPNKDFTVEDAFKVPVIETFFNNIEPEQPDDLLLTNKFFPLTFIDSSDIVTLHNYGYTGRTPATSKSAEVPTFMLPPLYVKDYQFGYWGEGIKFDKEALQKMDESRTPFLTAEGYVNQALQAMAYRRNKLMEWTAGQVAWGGSFTINANGINYTYSDGIPAFYRLDMTTGATFDGLYWTDAGLWSDTTNARPLTDIVEMSRYVATLGLTLEEMIMSSAIAKLIETNTDVIAWLKSNEQFAREAVTAKFAIEVIAKLKNVQVTIDDRTHTERAYVMANAGASATTYQVDDIANFAANDYVVVKQGKDQARCKVSSTSTDGLKKYVTVATTAGFALTAGKAVIDIGVPYSSTTSVLFRTSKQRCSGWMVLPDNIRAEDPMVAKIHLWSKFVNKEPNYWRELGNYFKGGIINREAGNYFTLKVQA